MTLKELVNNSLSKTSDPLIKDNIKWLLINKLNYSNTDYILKQDEELNEEFIESFKMDLDKHLNLNIPVQYILNKAYFYGNEFYVDDNVLIPRKETEDLIYNTINFIKDKYQNKEISILDLATGSGIIGITLKKELPHVTVTVSDISIGALKVARKNALSHQVDINIIESDWFKNIKDKYDVIISNPPYIKEDYILDTKVLKEPHNALFSGVDGLDSYKVILSEIKSYLNNNYLIAFEHGYDQKDTIREIALKYFNNEEIIQKRDLSNKDRYTFIIR